MRIRPRYDGPPILTFEGPVGDQSIPLLRQRRRLAGILAGLDDAGWATPSRCEAWSVQDVIAHLVQTNGFWFLSVQGALAGEPTRYLTDFDPVATPKLGAERMRVLPPADVLASYVDSVEQLAGVLSGLAEAQWTMPAEAPPGHIALHAMARHALWDAWTHERDVCIPLGIDTVDEPDELLASLEYAAALGPAFLASEGSTQAATLAVTAVDPDAQIVVEAGECVVVRAGDAPDGAAAIAGSTVDLIEALTYRAPFPSPLSDDVRRLVGGLGTVFEVPQGA